MCPPPVRSLAAQPQGTVKAVIVIGADTHKRSHTVAAIDAASGRALADQTVPARRRSFEALLVWARRHGNQRVWAIEDCRHVSGALERFLLAHGEAVVRVAPKLTVRERSSARERGKSDAIDAVAIARGPCAKASISCPERSSPGPSSTCACSSITANASFASAPRSATTCAGICTT